jgi:hypothetical protein
LSREHELVLVVVGPFAAGMVAVVVGMFIHPILGVVAYVVGVVWVFV